MSTTQTQFKAGETIFNTGDPGTAMYIVKSGEVQLMVGEYVVETVASDGFFGEMALVDHSTRSATALAKTDCELNVIQEKQFLFMVQETPFFSLKVLRSVVQRLRAMNQIAAN
jgi:CRP/FNR family transcriptional regulator, cyclic AMP receptor protein